MPLIIDFDKLLTTPQTRASLQREMRVLALELAPFIKKSLTGEEREKQRKICARIHEIDIILRTKKPLGTPLA